MGRVKIDGNKVNEAIIEEKEKEAAREAASSEQSKIVKSFDSNKIHLCQISANLNGSSRKPVLTRSDGQRIC